MSKPKSPKRRLTMKDVKKLFGPDYRMPSDKELEQAPIVSLEEVLVDLEKKYPPRKKAASNRLEKRLIRL